MSWIKSESLHLYPGMDSIEYNFEACCENIEMFPNWLPAELDF